MANAFSMLLHLPIIPNFGYEYTWMMDYKLVIEFCGPSHQQFGFSEICCEVTQVCYSFQNDSMHYLQMLIANTNRQASFFLRRR